jgi:hypothetical protein
MPGASTDDRLENNKLSDVPSKSVYSHHDEMQKWATDANLNTTIRGDDREARYRHFRDWENREGGNH